MSCLLSVFTMCVVKGWGFSLPSSLLNESRVWSSTRQMEPKFSISHSSITRTARPRGLRTKHRFKKLVRAAKRLRDELVEGGQLQSGQVPSFLVSSVSSTASRTERFLFEEDRYDRMRRVLYPYRTAVVGLLLDGDRARNQRGQTPLP